MLMMDYGSQYTGSTLGSDTLSGSVSSRQPNRVRNVRLVRPNHGALPPPGLTCRHGPNLGFSVRGGREHGTGFFVSQVELGSEAHRQGLRIGDQIIRVNGFTIEDAVHKEVLQLISNHTHLALKVRSVGMIPVKDKRTDPLSWQIISDCNSSTRSSPQLTEKNHDVRISIMVAPRSKLGCGICKGPEWKPGIFIQFTKEGGIAREAGLRPGDQILYCNNVDFGDISFNEAVNLMKASRQLDLIVRKSAGSELFPGESSGYNSSASSVTGDQSPSWSDSKRLSIVKEESLDLEDRLSNLDRFKNKKWEKIEWDDMDGDEKYHFKPTIINLSENGTTIKNNGSFEDCQEVKSNKLIDMCLVSDQYETKTVVVDVHRTDEDKTKTENKLCKSPSTSSFSSLASRSSTHSATTSLSSAISLELQRRSEKNKHQSKPTIDEQLQMKKVLRCVDSNKQQQHNKLMDEFKKAHRKMFKPSDNDPVGIGNGHDGQDRNINREFTQKVTERLSNLTKETPQEKSTTLSKQGNSSSTPPPPPPLPIGETPENLKSDVVKYPAGNRSKQKAPPPPVPLKTSTLSFHQPPPCPTPDYDTMSITSNSTLPRNGLKKSDIRSSQIVNDAVEMESLDSYHINNPTNNSPKPPNTYFHKSAQNGSISSATLRKPRPVSVTIGEYPSGSTRKMPGKFDFLQNGSDEADRGKEQPISSQLASELALTLNRSNLRKRTESMENILNIPQIKNETNGSIRISVNNNLNRSATHLENLTKALENRVTINIASNERKLDLPNGILKNGNGNHSLSSTSHRPLVHQKSITFGEMIQKLLFSEYCDFEDMVLVESSFAETTREGKGLRQVHLGLTPSKLVLATDILPLAKDTEVSYIPGIDPDIETFELIAVYPIECVNLSIFHRRKRQSLKARFCNNKILYFELGGFEKRNMFWNLWCEKVKFLNPENPNSSHSETSVATSTTDSTMYLVSSKRFLNQVGNAQLWCQYASGDYARSSPPPKWPDKHLYLGKLLDENPLKYTPCQNPPTADEFIKDRQVQERRYRHLYTSTSTMTASGNAQINRFSSGVKENCSTGLFLPAENVLLQQKFAEESESINAFLLYKTISGQFLDISELAENAIKMWEFYQVPSMMSAKSKHRRRYGFSPLPHFFQGLGPWNVNHGERFSLQMKRAVSVVSIKRQPVEPELRLAVSRRQLVASISCDSLCGDEKLINYTNNTIRIPPKRPVIFFWTPEYWYRPRSAHDAYQELQNHLKKIRQYHQIKDSFRSKFSKRRLTRNRIDESTSTSSDSDRDIISYKHNRRKRLMNKFRPITKKINKIKDIDETTSDQKETSMQFLKRILRMEVALTAWDFDSFTLAFQLTLIDKELFLKITPSELGVLVWQQSSKNAPNVGALIAFSHRISCLVVTEILKDDSEKIRARLVARFINTAEKCDKISNFQSCRSVLCGLQSPPVYRLYSMWTYVRKKHSSKYETFEKLCRLYRDPRLWTFQRAFVNASKTPPYLPFIGDLIGRLLDKIPEYNFISNTNVLGIKVSVKQKELNVTKNDSKREEIPTILQKILSSLKMWQMEEKCEVGGDYKTKTTDSNKLLKYKSLGDYYKPLNCFEDNRQYRLNECVQLLVKYQKAASNYLYTKNEMAREYLLKARYREDKDNFIYSFNIEPPVQLGD